MCCVVREGEGKSEESGVQGVLFASHWLFKTVCVCVCVLCVVCCVLCAKGSEYVCGECECACECV